MVKTLKQLKQAAALSILFSFLALAGCSEPPGSKPGKAANGSENNAEAESFLTPAEDIHWPNVNGSYSESNYSPLGQVATGNVAGLGLAWWLDLPGENTLEATPIAVDGVIYFSGNYSVVYAVDARTGTLLWRHDPEIWAYEPSRMSLQFIVSRGVAYADGRIFAATYDGRLQALDAKTGELLWSSKAVDDGALQYITGAPRVFNDKVIIGNGGGDYGSRGYATAYFQKNGEQAWRFYVAPGSPDQNKGNAAMEKAAATWTGEYWKTGTGGGPWNAFTFDPQLNQVYIGTGNAGPMDPQVRSPGSGDNLYIASIVAVDADSGEYIWHYQVNPREAWEYKATADMIATTLEIDGEARNVLIQLPTNGFFYLIDRETGKLISAEKSGKVNWASHIDLESGRPVENPGMRYENGETRFWPSSIGAHNWQPMAYSAKTGLVYIPYMQAGGSISRGVTREGDVALAGLNIGWAFDETDEADGTASLLAWDPVQQKQAWKVALESFWNGGVLATAGNLVFQGTGTGFLFAYDGLTGERVWAFNAGLGIIGAPISYSVDGKQYISVLVGYGGAASIGSNLMNEGWKYGAQPRRLLTFSLDGEATLPPAQPKDMTINPVDDTAIHFSDEDVESGRLHYLTYFCIVCHGRDLVGGGTAPDLRESGVALDLDSLWAVVHDGALISKGMPPFEDITKEDMRQIQAYIIAGAREALGTRETSGKKAAGGGI